MLAVESGTFEAAPNSKRGITVSKKNHMDQQSEGLQLVCTYCDRKRNDAGTWERSQGKTISKEKISHGICPRCLKKHFPGVYFSLCREGKISLEDAKD